MLPKICLVLTSCLFSIIVSAKSEQFNTPNGMRPGTQSTIPVQPAVPVQPKVQALQPQPVQPVFNYKRINAGLQYAFIINKPTSPNPQDGDQINVNMQMVSNDRLLFNSAVTFKGKPAVYGVTKPAFKGDIIEAIMFMTPGDSIVCLVSADSLFKNTKNKKPDFIKQEIRSSILLNSFR